jgi:hypothetical protein
VGTRVRKKRRRTMDKDKSRDLETHINQQEIVRRNLEALCTVWKTFNTSERCTIPDDVWEETLLKIREHVKKLSA